MPAATPTSTLPEERSLAPRRVGYAVTSAVLSLLIGLAYLDGCTEIAVYGVDSATIHADGPDGTTLAVTYPEAARPALAAPFDIRVERPGGFDGPVQIAVDHEYFRMWDANGLSPAPSSETTDGEWLLWEFDPPEGDVLAITFDARIEPAAQEGRSGAVALLGDDGETLATVEFTTRVLP